MRGWPRGFRRGGVAGPSATVLRLFTAPQCLVRDLAKDDVGIHKTRSLDMTKPKLLYVITEDWFFASHFLPMARAARDAGFDVCVAARFRAHRNQITSEGVRAIPVEAERGQLSPLALLRIAFRLRQVMREEQPDIVHLIALKSILVGGLAARLANVEHRVVAVTGLGLLGAAEGTVPRIARSSCRAMLTKLVDGPGTRYIFENRDDPVFFGLDPGDRRRVTIVPGAGVDPLFFAPQPMSAWGTLRLAIVSRMLWSKGVDVVVEAVQKARARKADITLSIFGAPDASNPRAIPVSVLKRWSANDGIGWLGATDDVRDVWAKHHVAVLASRGGEGLPKTLLEAAACGRAIITTDVNGCRDFIRDGVEGLIVPPNDSDALCNAILRFAEDRGLVERCGVAARQRVVEGYTEKMVGDATLAVYRDLLDG